MIPKIIHYCWFGHASKPELVEKCIKSWKKYCPDYEIKEWNEDNFDYTQCQYAADAYKEKKWGFVPDFIRLKLIYDYGGIYLDTDVELLKSLDPLLNMKAVLGFESTQYVNTGLITMAEAHNSIIKTMYELYYTQSFYNQDGSLNLIASPKYNTKILVQYGLQPNNTKQTISDGISQITIFPTEYFCPKNFDTGALKISPNTFAVHHFAGSWLSPSQKKANELRKYIFSKCKNRKNAEKIYEIICKIQNVYQKISNQGLSSALMYYIKKYIFHIDT